MAKSNEPQSSLPKSELKDLVGRLGALPRFADLSKSDLELLAKSSALSAVPPNWPLINEQTPADACYVILDGDVEVRVDGKPVAQLAAGSVVGEVGLLTSKLRNATVVSTSRVSVLHLVPEVFNSLVSQSPSIRAALQGPADSR
ncbi:MAG TPA: cyclic nucleotide-binding domain-containing protein [Mycobacteriales bacterium]|nr:cyclic nucleotide-binding domain-containing protein [Mycobacteriales bacterium]